MKPEKTALSDAFVQALSRALACTWPPAYLAGPNGAGGRCWRGSAMACAALLLSACGIDRPLRTPNVSEAIRAEVPMPASLASASPAAVPVPLSVANALAEPAPPRVAPPPEPRIDLLVNNASAREVFLAMVADTRYSMLLHPDVAGTLSVTLRGVTVAEALEAIRDVYGYDFKMDDRRITVYAPTLQTRIFTINYPHTSRDGTSDLRVSSGAMPNNTANGSPAAQSQQGERSSVTTESSTDLWAELTAAICTMINAEGGACALPRQVKSKSPFADALGPSTMQNTNKLPPLSPSNPGYNGRSVVTSPQAGIMAVRAMPDELRQVEKFLKAAQVSVQRQVMLEAKIVEVELRDGYQSGIDWSGLKNSGNSTGAFGVLSGNATNNSLISGVQYNLPGFAAGAGALLADGAALPAAGTGLFGLALATEGFQAVLGFLETRGDVQILSSPRIATLNNQKALLKVGTDEFFVTNVTLGSGGSTTYTPGQSAANVTAPTMPTLEFASFFSGISLDVTPQIDDGNTITLHVRPSITSVTEKSKQIDLGSAGNYKLPLASSNVNESDTLVRIQDGKIVAIGGLMQVESNRTSSGLPGSTESIFSSLLGNKANTGRKKEVVVLIKPTIIRNQQDWDEQGRRSRAALDDMDAARTRVIRIDGQVLERPLQ